MKFITNLFSKTKKNENKKPSFEFLFPYVIVILLGFIVADLTILQVRPVMLPKEAPPKKPKKAVKKKLKSKSLYTGITKRNIFNPEGKIPKSLSELKKEADGTNKEESDEDKPAVLSRLPMTLLGTIVHFDPKKSIATISLSSKGKSGSWVVDEEVEDLAKIISVERKKVIFRNLNNRKKEYIEIPDDSKLSFGKKAKKSSGPAKDNNIVQVRGNNRVIKRSDFEDQLSNIGGLLKQAKVVPVKNSDGEVTSFKFVNIRPGSVFEKLGFKRGDEILGVNNEAVTSAAQAMDLLNAFKSGGDKVNLNIKRNGKKEDFNYVVE